MNEDGNRTLLAAIILAGMLSHHIARNSYEDDVDEALKYTDRLIKGNYIL